MDINNDCLRVAARVVPFSWFWRFRLERMTGRILGESRLAKGWREGVMVRAAMTMIGGLELKSGLFWRRGAKWGLQASSCKLQSVK